MPPSLSPTHASVSRALDTNNALIAAVLSHHNNRRHAAAAALLARVQANLAYVASVADASSGARDAARGLAPAPPPAAPQAPRARAPVRFWSADEHARFLDALGAFDGKPDLKIIAEAVGSRTPTQVRSHLQKHLKKIAKGKGGLGTRGGRGRGRPPLAPERS